MARPEHIERFLSRLRTRFAFEPDCEITLEAHPLTVDKSSLAGYRSAGVTRISFGAESFDVEELSGLGRRHDAHRVWEAVCRAREVGLSNVNLDFMYGLLGQTEASWHDTLARALEIRPHHLSLYPLSIEPRTVFARKRRRGELSLPTDDTVAEMYHHACAVLRAAGYEHYEVANWALPGHASRHNLAYWLNREYYGIGVGAHANLGTFRTENMTGTQRYIDIIFSGRDPVVTKTAVDHRIEYSETVMLRLRLLREGLDTSMIQSRFGVDILAEFESDIRDLVDQDLLIADGTTLKLPEVAVPVGNEVWERFLR